MFLFLCPQIAAADVRIASWQNSLLGKKYKTSPHSSLPGHPEDAPYTALFKPESYDYP